jgi:hypothetical protein
MQVSGYANGEARGAYLPYLQEVDKSPLSVVVLGRGQAGNM